MTEPSPSQTAAVKAHDAANHAADDAAVDISLIVAMARNGVIGAGNRLPWRLRGDLKRFRQLTLNKPIIMGRRTWESLPGALDQRLNIVVTRQADYQREHAVQSAEVAHSLKAALELARVKSVSDEIMIIGGANLYAQALPLAQRIYLTEVQAEVPGDVHFPDWDPEQWTTTAITEQAADAHNEHAVRYIDLRRSLKL